MVESLWGEEFEVPDKVEKTKKVLDKISKPKELKVTVEKQIKSKKLSVEDRLALIKENVLRILSKQVDNVEVIRTKEALHDYITKCIANKIIAIDTETNNSLDPITCKLMGLCLYSDGLKQTYIPVNHVDYKTGELLPDQVTEADIKEELERLNETFTVTHNGKFDYQVLKCTCGVKIRLDWDTMIGAKLLDENERSAGLKQQYIDKIDPEQEKYSIDQLFENVKYEWVEPEIFALYSATDSFMTLKLYYWQKKRFEDPDNSRLYNLAKTVEMPLVEVVAEMELNGVEFDKEYDERLSKKYHAKLDALDVKINEELNHLKPKIEAWKLTDDATFRPKKKSGEGEGKSKLDQLTDPINVASPTQLAILFYDILKVGVIDPKSPRGTGEDILEKIKLPLAELLLERRGLMKLTTAFIDSLPGWVNPKTGRIHCHFNAYGAATGRFSSSDPNLQQIPSHNHELRLLFKARDGNILVGSDFSQQEPRVLSQFSHDENMINAYKQGKDLYATIAAGVYHNNYEDNLEFNPITKQLNPEGKARRSSVKSLLLGIMYGRGVASIAEQIHGTKEDAQNIIDGFYKSFPKVKTWIDETQAEARKKGYVEDLWGRRRRLPDILLPEYEIKLIGDQSGKDLFNPFLLCENRKNEEAEKLISKYNQKLKNIKYRKDYERIKSEALKEGIEIHSNTGFIAQAERQCVNARIQGSSATMTKKAMINLYRDKRLNELGFKLLIGVHDELIGECPLEYKDEVAERLTSIMKSAAADVCEVPFKCDAELATCWYLPQYTAEIEEQFDDLLKTKSPEEAFEFICSDRIESTRTQLYEIVKNKLNFVPADVDLNYKSIYE